MTPSPWSLITVAALLATSASTASAQDGDSGGAEAAAPDDVVLVPPAPRQGYFISLGAGLSVNSNSSDDEGTIGPLTGAYFNLRLGEMVTDWLGFGFHAGGGFASDDRWSAGFGGGMLDAQFVPWDHLAVRFGVGAGGLSVTDNVEEQESLLGTGGGYYLVGLSYDWFPFHSPGESGGFSLTPALQGIYLPGATFQSTLIVLSIETTWWSGLDKNKLDLPDDEAYTEDE
ncbi:MAG: hypothetical protein CMH57_12640 [Myxococcales bacterium]|nr:hypothetical protein [Myxococcales bacterium]